jgi:hypothetical protein
MFWQYPSYIIKYNLYISYKILDYWLPFGVELNSIMLWLISWNTILWSQLWSCAPHLMQVFLVWHEGFTLFFSMNGHRQYVNIPNPLGWQVQYLVSSSNKTHITHKYLNLNWKKVTWNLFHASNDFSKVNGFLRRLTFEGGDIGFLIHHL